MDMNVDKLLNSAWKKETQKLRALSAHQNNLLGQELIKTLRQFGTDDIPEPWKKFACTVLGSIVTAYHISGDKDPRNDPTESAVGIICFLKGVSPGIARMSVMNILRDTQIALQKSGIIS